MARPFPDMPYWAALPAMGPIPENSTPGTYGLHPLATGPYKFDHYVPDKSLTLVRNEAWEPTTDAGRHDYPDRYEFQFTVAATTTGRAILADTGDAQTTLSFGTPPANLLNLAISEAPDRVTVGPTPCVYVLSPDYRTITDLRVRQAIGYAFPYADVINASGANAVTASPSRTLIPASVPGAKDYNPLSTEPGQTDPDKAKSLLAEAGFNVGEYPLRFAYDTNDPLSVASKDALAAGFEAGGFAVHPYKTSSEDELHAVQADAESPLNLRFGADGFSGWCSDWPSGNATILPLLSSKASDRTNFGTYFHDPEVDAAINRIDELPLDDQPAAWGALDEQVETNHYPFVVTEVQRSAMLHGSRIGGMNNDATSGMPTWKDIYVLR